MTITEDAPEVVDRFVETPTFRIHYVEAGTGHPVVLLHGSGPGATGTTNFAPNIAPLALLNRCGHWAQLEHADDFNRLVTTFVQAA